MKFLYFGDRHYSALKTPPNRIDDFLETTKNKDLEIINIAKKENVTAFLQPGDFFNEKDVKGENDFLSEIINRWNMPSASKLLNSYLKTNDEKDIISSVNNNIPIIGIAGNHDLIGNSLDTLNDTTLGLLSSLGLMRLVSKENPIFFETEDGLKVAITGTSYHLHQDEKEYLDDYIVTEKLGDIHIHIVHGMLSDKDMGTLIKHTLIDNIVDTKADITLCGHNHIGFGIKNINGKYFINIGSVTRFTGDLKEITRVPSVVLIDISKKGILVEEISLKSAPVGTDVIDRSVLDEERKKKASISKFRKEAESMKTKTKPDMSDFVESIADNESIPDDIKNDILDRLVIKEKENAKIKAIKTNAFITKIILENFQSHKYNEFDLSNGFNVFVGESRQGKSAVLRAFYWVYTNKPSGKSFIKRGADYCKVSLILSDNTIVSRFIEDKKNGKNGYEIIYPDGSSESGNTKLLEKVQRILGYNDFYIDKKLSLPVNFYKQGESWYLIGDAQTNTDKARIIGALSGTNFADAIVRDLDTENTKALVSFKVAKQKAEELNKEVESFEYLETLKDSLDKMKIKLDRFKNLETLKSNLRNLSVKMQNLNKNLTEKEEILKELSDLDLCKDKLIGLKKLEYQEDLLERGNTNYLKVKESLNKQMDILIKLLNVSDLKKQILILIDLNSNFKKLVEYKEKIEKLKRSIIEKEQIITQTENIEFIDDACKMMRNAENELIELTSLLQNINRIINRKTDLSSKISNKNIEISNFDKVIANKKVLEGLRLKNEKLIKLINVSDKSFEIMEKIYKEESKLVQTEDKLQKAKQNYSKVLEEVHICPICKEPLSKEKIDEIVYNKKGY